MLKLGIKQEIKSASGAPVRFETIFPIDFIKKIALKSYVPYFFLEALCKTINK